MDADIKAASLRTGLLGKPSNRITYPLRVACVVFPAVLFCGLAWIDYRIELARTRNDVVTATNAIAEHAQTVVETVDLVIARVQDHIGRQSWASLAASQETHDFLDRLRRELPQVEAVFLVDPNGIIAASTRAYPMPRYDVHDAEYFAAPKAQDNDAMVVSAPFLGTISGTKGFIISRRRLQDGKFDGVVAVTVSPAYFETFYRAILDTPTNSAAALIRTDGALLVRFPELPGHPAAVPPYNPTRVPSKIINSCWWRPEPGTMLLCSTAVRSSTAISVLPASNCCAICRCSSAIRSVDRCS